MKNAIILVSGGLDSYVLAHYLKKRLKQKVKLVFIDYKQKSLNQELSSVKKLAKELRAKLEIIHLPWLGKISTSLINQSKKPKGNELISWYVPCRNSLFLILALAFAESKFINHNEKNNIYIGIKYENISFKDTSPKFLEAINKLAEFTQSGKYKINAPFINMDKEDIIDLGKKLDVKLENSYSCYLSSKIHCGKCAGCLSRKKGFKFSNTKDPTIYL